MSNAASRLVLNSPICLINLIDFLRALRQPFAAVFSDQVGVLHSDSTQTGIEDLGLNGEDDTGLEWRVEFRRDHRNLIKLQTDAVCYEPDLIFAGAHEMRGE